MRSHLHRLPRLLGLLVAVPAFAAGQDPAATADVVVTSFGWPVGTAATVTTYQRMVREGAGTDSDIVIEGSYDFDVTAHDEGVLVRHGNFTTTNFTSVPELPPDHPVYLLYTRLGSITPNYVVSHGGELVRVEGIEEMRDGMMEVLRPILDSIPEQAAALDGMMQQITSNEYLFSQLVEQWNLMVGFWIDAELEVGAVYEFEDEAPSPLVPTELIPFLYEFSAAERVPCSSSHPPDSCVRLEFWSTPDPAVVADLLTGWLEQLGPGAATRIDSLEQESYVSLVADPTTLLPHRWEMSRVFSMTGTDADETTEAARVDETVYEFTYR